MSVAFPPATPLSALAAHVARLKERSRDWARCGVAEKIELLAQLRRNVRELAPKLVASACEAKGLSPGHPLCGEEWLGGPVVVVRTLRLLEQSLKDIQRHGVPTLPPGHVRVRSDGRLAVKVYPLHALDAVLLPGTTLEAYLRPGITPDTLAQHLASFYRAPSHQGRLCVVLGAGNVNSIPALDCLHKLFVEGAVCLLKVNPVNAYVGPFLERAFAPLVERGALAVVYGGVEEGGYLVQHPEVDEVHMTGSDRTHDALVWGPPGPERERRKITGERVLAKPLSSELGNISPVLVVPGPYRSEDLAFQGRSIAGMVAQNGSFNCVSAKLLVTPESAPFRGSLLEALETGLAAAPVRKAWYPGAKERWRTFVDGRKDVRLIGEEQPDTLRWALIPGVDPLHTGDPVFRQEPWCALLSETALPGRGPASFLSHAVRFLNEQVWGTLCATLIVHPETLEEPSSRAAVEQSIDALQYGSVTVNTWPATVFGLGSPAWGGHPSSTAEDIHSGLGMGHNALMLEGVEKVVAWAPFRPVLKPLWWPGFRTLDEVGRRLLDFEDAPSWLKLPGLTAAALRA